jgi:hypothetical protein
VTEVYFNLAKKKGFADDECVCKVREKRKE